MNNKILIDLANPLDFSTGTVTLVVSNIDSLGDQIQREFPLTKVVKTLNTVTASVMVNLEILGTKDHDIFLCGDDKDTKEWVVNEMLAEWFGWKNVIDLGDITAARSMEMYLPMWIKMYGINKSALFNIHFVKKPES